MPIPPHRQESEPAREQGRIIEWNAARGFGFVDDGRRRTFVHIRDFAERGRTPKVGDTLAYTPGRDAQGRTCGHRIVALSPGGRIHGRHLLLLAVLLAAPGAAVWRLLPAVTAQYLTGWLVLASAATFGLYAWDKRRARLGAWRTPENFLHLWELLGGWPGAYLAQRRLRHKSAKLSYQSVFWLIVVAHQYVAVDAQLGWRIFARVRLWLASLF